MALIKKLENIGNAIREKTGKTDLLTLEQMVTEIAAIETGGGDSGLPEEAFIISGSCQYRFASGGWDWFVEEYGNKITTENIDNAINMFSDSNLEEIPFDINLKSGSSVSVNYLFQGCYNLTKFGKIIGRITDSQNIFANCKRLREITLEQIEGIDWTTVENSSSAWGNTRGSIFSNCHSLRSFPMEFLAHGNPKAYYSYTIYPSCFNCCYALDEVIGLPFPHNQAEYTSNIFSSTFKSCERLKEMTFATQEDGTPVTVNWSNQTIDLSSSVGYAYGYQGETTVIAYNSGITVDKYVTNDDLYAALKDDPDWYGNKSYSRYNHNSAVNTINSLPSTTGTGCTIKFLGEAGSKTDGGAINTLTEEEIAVATAKGWTVTLV